MRRTKRPTHNCEVCGREFGHRYGKADKNRFCSTACAAQRRPRREHVTHRQVRALGHPVAPPSGIVAVARLVLYEKIGGGPHSCHWCGKPVRWLPGAGLAVDALLADHVNFDTTDDSPENLVPACNSCNAHRTSSGRRTTIRDGELTVEVGGARTRAVRRTCELCGGEFVIPPAAIRRGRGRFCSRSCARKQPRS